MKRIITFMMALALVLSLGVTAFADGETNGKITITNATVGQTYMVYKIFDATYTGTGDDQKVAYTIDKDHPYFVEMFGAAGDNTGSAKEVFVYDKETGKVTMKDGATRDALIAYLTNLVKNKDVVDAVKHQKVAQSATVVFDNLEPGYYVIKRDLTDANGNPVTSVVTIDTTAPEATVIDKNQIPGNFDKEVSSDGTAWEDDDQNSASVGDTVYFKLSFLATNYDGEKKINYYTITDTLNPTNWAKINLNSIQIKLVNGEGVADDVILIKDADWEFVSSSDSGFVIKIHWVNSEKAFKYDELEEVELTYNAEVLAGATSNNGAQSNKNEASMDWDKNTDDDKPDDETETEVFNLGFAKVDGDDNTIKLAGAIFALTDAEGEPVYVTGENGVYTVIKEGTTNLVETKADGAVIIKGLAAGTYYLNETKAPDGYNKLADPVEIVVGEGQDSALKINGVDYVANNEGKMIENNSGVELPETGGKGTIMMITIGTLVAMAFAVLLITQKKMSIYRG